MTIAMNDGTAALRKPIRLWPGVAAAALLCLLKFGLPLVMPDGVAIGMIGGVLCGLAILVWWAFFSRAPGPERWGALVLLIAAMAVTSRGIDKSIATGMMGFMFPIVAIPTASLALAIGAVAGRRLPTGARRAVLAAAIVTGCAGWLLLRTDGIKGNAASELAWRWTKTPEQRLLARSDAEPAALPPPVVSKRAAPATLSAKVESVPTPAILSPPRAANLPSIRWAGFRGAHRDSIIAGAHIDTDWSASPPVQLWRRAIGPGWSSFAVQGDLLYTQEQRGDDEVVACYDASSGKPVWAHRDAARFWESNGGAGPRGTPTLSDGRVYTFGATGIVNALDARDGTVVWSRNAGTDAERKIPGWGFSSSPLVVDDVVIVAASGRLAGYDAATGNPKWLGPSGGGSYSSPHLVTLDGVPQVVLLSGTGAVSVAPATGEVLWQHEWNAGGTPIVQPSVASDRDLLISGVDMSGGIGIRRIAVEHAGSAWTPRERWTSAALKPYFNDYVVHDGHAFGFDGSILACVDLKDGKRKWKGGRYGNGQLVLLPEQNVLLVLSEEGELALVAAGTDQFKELARFPAIEGKTWNHPVLVGNVLLVRNGQEMAAFRLPGARP